jgi:GDP-4-dehydro-6-deoxy-D-mannose reductase
MRALVTGINGFAGGHLANFLIKKNFKVFGVDRIETKIRGIIFFKIDITNKGEVSNLIKDSNPDLIFHLAAVSSVKACKENPQSTKNVNIIGTENLLSACIKNNINPKILIPSSAHVYGIPEYTPIDEMHPVNPINEYAKSKFEQENVSLKFFKEHNLNVIISRSFNHIGPNQPTGFVCSDFAKQIAEIEKELIKPEIHVGDLSPIRDFSDVRDIIRAYLLLLEKGKSGEKYNVGSGIGYTIKEILTKLIEKSISKINIIEDKSLFRKSEIPTLIANNKKFVDITNWKPEFSIDQSLKDILDYWRKQV